MRRKERRDQKGKCEGEGEVSPLPKFCSKEKRAKRGVRVVACKCTCTQISNIFDQEVN
jgi:hypothetical protein